MSAKTDKAVEEVNELVSSLSSPSKMTVEEAREFYEDLRDNLTVMLEALGT